VTIALAEQYYFRHRHRTSLNIEQYIYIEQYIDISFLNRTFHLSVNNFGKLQVKTF
jgi:hypothetical protein